jgi:hypothetical protein
MNKTAILALLRHGLTFLGGALASQGVADSAEIEQGIGAVITLIGLGWSIYEKKNRPSGNLPPGVSLLIGSLLFLPMAGLISGCAGFRNVQEDRSVVISPDGTREERNIVSRQSSRSFFDSKASLRGFSVQQTDKTQSTKLGSLDQQTSSTGAVQTLRIVVESAAKAALP